MPYLWILNYKSSRVYFCVTWSKVRKRLSKPNLLFGRTDPTCVAGEKAPKPEPCGHGES